MQFIDYSLVSKQERADRATNEVLQSLVDSYKNNKFDIDKHKDDLDYIKAFRDTRLKKDALSKNGDFRIAATFPIEVNLQMVNKHGPHWADKPGVLADFLTKNPQYRVGTGTHIEEMLQRVDGPICVVSKEDSDASV